MAGKKETAVRLIIKGQMHPWPGTHNPLPDTDILLAIRSFRSGDANIEPGVYMLGEWWIYGRNGLVPTGRSIVEAWGEIGNMKLSWEEYEPFKLASREKANMARKPIARERAVNKGGKGK